MEREGGGHLPQMPHPGSAIASYLESRTADAVTAASGIATITAHASSSQVTVRRKDYIYILHHMQKFCMT